jgi:hypothetical protein
MNNKHLARYLSLDLFIAPLLIKIIYWIGVVAIVGAGIGAMLNGLQTADKPLLTSLLSIGGILLCLLLWRLLSELGILAFNIYERLVEIRDLMVLRQLSEEHEPLSKISSVK